MMSLNPEFAACRASAWAVLEVINRTPEIDGSEEAPGAQSAFAMSLFASPNDDI